jgi:hypothetical protein
MQLTPEKGAFALFQAEADLSRTLFATQLPNELQMLFCWRA